MHKHDFEAMAATWESDAGRMARAWTIAEAVRAAVRLGSHTRLLDYGCGPGLLPLALHSEVGETVAADISEETLAALRARTEAAGLAGIRVLKLDLETQDAAETDFDVIVSSMTFHHLSEPQLVLNRLAAVLADGGTVLIADLDAGSEAFHGEETGIVHPGFGADEMRAMFAAAGLRDVTVSEGLRIRRETGEFAVLITVGKK